MKDKCRPQQSVRLSEWLGIAVWWGRAIDSICWLLLKQNGAPTWRYWIALMLAMTWTISLSNYFAAPHLYVSPWAAWIAVLTTLLRALL